MPNEREESRGLRQIARDETPDVTDFSVVRSFRYPGGPIWFVGLVDRSAEADAVLRFTAGDRHFDLLDWPKDWADYPDAELVRLLRGAGTAAEGKRFGRLAATAMG